MHARSDQVLMMLTVCPDCPTARDARAMFLELGPWRDLLIALAPFAVCIAIVLAAAQLIAARRGGSRAGE